MTITTATNASPAVAAANSAVAKTQTAGFGSDFNSFLTLLTAQLKNQDPTKAMDTTEMTNQLVQFAQVEQQIKMNASLTDLIGLEQASALTAAAPLLGRTVELTGDKVPLQDGAATFRLPAAGRARDAVLRIEDASGGAVRSIQIKLGESAADYVWDGRNARGDRVPDGGYSFVLEGYDSLGGAVPLSATVLGRVTGVERDGGKLTLLMGKLPMSFDQVRSVKPA